MKLVNGKRSQLLEYLMIIAGTGLMALAINPRDLTSLFCNLLENAVESAENIPDSFIELTVQKKENSPFLIIILINSCQNTPVYNPEGLPISRKSDNGRHGF